jgi:hypothetical protein
MAAARDFDHLRPEAPKTQLDSQEFWQPNTSHIWLVVSILFSMFFSHPTLG